MLSDSSEGLEGLNCRFGTADGPCMNFWKLWLPPPVLTAIISGPRPRPTLRVWGVVMVLSLEETDTVGAPDNPIYGKPPESRILQIFKP